MQHPIFAAEFMSNQNVTAMKRIVLIILMVLLPMCAWCQNTATGYKTATIDGITYTYDTHTATYTPPIGYLQYPGVNECKICDVDGDLPETLVLPDFIDGRKVVQVFQINREQAGTNPEVKHVRLPFYCRSIGGNTFIRFPNLESVVMETHMEYIYSNAFANCDKLKSVTSYALTPPSSTVISDYDRRERAHVKPFGDNVFAQATLHVRPGCGVSYKETVEWADFANVEEMDMPDGRDGDIRTGYVNGVPYLYTILSAADKTCMFGKEVENSLIVVPYGDPLLVWRDYANWQAVRSFTDVDTIAIPAVIDGYTVTELGYGCLWGQNVHYKHIVIPETVTTIRGGMTGTTQVYTLNIPASVTYIGPDVAKACLFTVDPANPVYDSRNDCGAIIHTATNTLVRLGSKVVVSDIPEGIEAIGDWALISRSIWPDLELPASIKQVGIGAFAYTIIWRAVIPSFMTDIPDYLLIGSHAEQIELHENVKSIGTRAFSSQYLKAVVARSETPPELGENVFSHVDFTLYVPDDAVATYKSTPGWGEIKEIKGLSEFPTGIGTAEADDAEEASAIYTLSGIRLSAPPAKGLYIVNGKKVLAR